MGVSFICMQLTLEIQNYLLCVIFASSYNIIIFGNNNEYQIIVSPGSANRKTVGG